MGEAKWKPAWWTEDKHGSAWARVREAMRRDWEQTKADLHLGGRDLDQDVDDTIKQAAGKEPIPGAEEKSPSDPVVARGGAWSSAMRWDDVEPALSYGYCAREEYGREHASWNPDLERRLRTEWETDRGGGRAGWDAVKPVVRAGYERGVA